MADRSTAMSIAALESDLGTLGASIDYPTIRPDFAVAVQQRLQSEPAPARSWWARMLGRPTELSRDRGRPLRPPLRRALVLAVVLLLVLAAIAGAIGLGLPGIRILFGPGTSPSPTATQTPNGSAVPGASLALGASLGLGELTPLDQVEGQTGFRPLLPEGLGSPSASYVRDKRLMMVWPVSDSLPEVETRSRVGLIVTEFRGRIDKGYFDKMLNAGSTIEPVTVAGQPGYWLAGAPHGFWYVDENGKTVDETRRMVGQALIWAGDTLTFRLETSLPRDEAIRLAESLR